MAPATDIAVVISVYDGRTSSGSMDVRIMPVNRRAVRALRTLGWCWLFAVITVLVPFLHWVLVPGLALLGPILALRTFGFDREVCGGGGPCPVCQSPIPFVRFAHPESFSTACGTCRFSLQVQRAPAAKP